MIIQRFPHRHLRAPRIAVVTWVCPVFGSRRPGGMADDPGIRDMGFLGDR